MYLPHIVSIPILVLVFVLLLSQVGVKMSIAGTNDVQINLTDPRVLAELSSLPVREPGGCGTSFKSAPPS
jgi:hypothetical protein